MMFQKSGGANGSKLNGAFAMRYRPLCGRITAVGKKRMQTYRENPSERGCILWGKSYFRGNRFSVRVCREKGLPTECNVRGKRHGDEIWRHIAQRRAVYAVL